jgi:hypothetical protein
MLVIDSKSQTACPIMLDINKIATLTGSQLKTVHSVLFDIYKVVLNHKMGVVLCKTLAKLLNN